MCLHFHDSLGFKYLPEAYTPGGRNGVLLKPNISQVDVPIRSQTEMSCIY